jgi:mRNA-degrading endonuclease YafQ of YafQ-DinJ toxin-antitoxin module
VNLFKKYLGNGLNHRQPKMPFWLRLELFTNNPFDVTLKTHKLSGKLKGLYAFSIEYDIRVVFYFTKDNPPQSSIS